MLAAAWFLLRGYEVLWPLEPCRYDLAVRANGAFYRVQVKTTTCGSGASSLASISSRGRKGRVVYEWGEVDLFFVIDADLNAFLIPLAAVGGYQLIHLQRYRTYQVAECGQWLAPSAAEAAAS